MICKRCHRKFEAEDGVCPHCGEANPPLNAGILKTSTILISAGATDAVFRSVKEMPDKLRRRLLKSTSGLNAATILIADRRGREELAKAIRRLPSPAQRKLMKAVFGEESESGASAASATHRKVLFVLLVLVTALVLWWVYSWRG